MEGREGRSSNGLIRRNEWEKFTELWTSSSCGKGLRPKTGKPEAEQELGKPRHLWMLVPSLKMQAGPSAEPGPWGGEWRGRTVGQGARERTQPLGNLQAMHDSGTSHHRGHGSWSLTTSALCRPLPGQNSSHQSLNARATLAMCNGTWYAEETWPPHPFSEFFYSSFIHWYIHSFNTVILCLIL